MSYAQTNPQWSWLHIGSSALTVGSYGCLLTAFATALKLSGYDFTPAEVAQSAIFTSGGLFDWYRAAGLFPEITGLSLNGSRRFKFVQVTASFPSGYVGEHWLLLLDGTYYDPLYGGTFTSLPVNYVASGVVRSYDIAQKVPQTVVIPVEFVPNPTPPKTFGRFEVNLSPSQDYSDEVKRVQEFLVAKGFMDDQGQNDGYYGPITQHAVNGFQRSHGIIADNSYFGWWYSATRAAANNDLTILPTTTSNA